MAVKKQIAIVEVMCNTKQAVQMLDEYKRLATDTLTKIETKTKELNALKAKGANATAADKKQMTALAKEIKTLTADFNKYNSATQKGIDSHRKLSQVMKDLSGAKLKDLKAALRDLNRMMGDVSNKTPQRAKVIQNAIAKVQGQINNLQTSTKTFGTTHNSVWQTAVRNITAYMGVMAGFNWVKQKVLDVMKANREFSDQLANIRKVSGLAMSDINELANRLAKIDTRSTVQELNQLAYTGSKLGFGEYGIEGLESFVKSALKVQNALKEDMGEDAMTALSKMVEVMGLIPKMGVEKAMDATGSAIFKLASTSTATGSNIVEFSKRLMGLANQAGIATEELLAFGSAADSMALMPEVAATAFNKLITAVQKQPNLIENALHIEPGTISNMFQMGKMADAMVLIFEKMREKGGMNALMHSGVFKDLGSDGARLVGVMATMADRVDILNKHMETSRKAFKEATAVEMEYNIQMETAEAYMERAANLWTKAFVNPEGVDNVKSFAEAWYEVSKSLTENKLVMFELQLALQGLVLAFKGLMTILPAVLYALGTRGLIWTIQTLWPLMLGLITGTNGFSLALTKVRAQWAAMSVAMKANWISAAIGLLIQLSIYLVSTSDKLKEILGIETEAEKRMKALSNAYADAHNAADNAAKGLENYKKALDQANLSQREREGLINKFKNEFGVYLNYLNKEIKTVDDLRDAYADVVKVMKQKKLYEEREKYKQDATGESKTENRRTGVQIDEELKRLGVDTEKYNSSYFQKQFRADPAKLIAWMMRDQFAGAKEGKDEGVWVQNENNRRSYKSYNVRRLTELVTNYMEKARAIARDEEEADKMWANDLKGFDNDAFEQSKFENHVHTYDSLEDAPDKAELAAAKKAAQDAKQAARKELKDAETETNAIIAKVEEWYTLQQTAVTEAYNEGRITEQKMTTLNQQLEQAKNTALAAARRSLSGQDTQTWKTVRANIGELMFDQGEWSKELLTEIFKTDMDALRNALARFDGKKSLEQWGFSSTAFRDSLNKKAAQNDAKTKEIDAKMRNQVEAFLLQYDYINQTFKSFSTQLENLGILTDTATDMTNRLNGGAPSQKTQSAHSELLKAFIAQGSNPYTVNPNDTASLTQWLREFTGFGINVGKGGVATFEFNAISKPFADDFALWLSQAETYKQKIQEFFMSLLAAEDDYYKKRKEAYNAAKTHLDQSMQAAGWTDKYNEAETELGGLASIRKINGEGTNFLQQHGLQDVMAQDPEIKAIQLRIAMRQKEYEEAKALGESQQLIAEKQNEMLAAQADLAEKVGNGIADRISKLKELTAPLEEFGEEVGQKLGDALFSLESTSDSWSDITKKMILSVSKMTLQMGSQYLQQQLQQALTNKAMEAQEMMHQQTMTGITVAGGMARVVAEETTNAEILTATDIADSLRISKEAKVAAIMAAFGVSEGAAKTIAALGFWGIPLIGVITSVLMGLLSSALSTAGKSDSNSSSTKVKLVSGMLTYDEGNVGQYVGSDGHVYSARQQSSLPEGVSLVRQPIATTVNGQPSLVAEKGPEIVIGRRTTRQIMMNEPGLLRRIAQIERGGGFYTRGGMRTLDSGNLEEVLNLDPTSGSSPARGGEYDKVAAALEANSAALAAFTQLMGNIQQKGIPAKMAAFGDGSLDEGMRTVSNFRKKYPD